MENDLKMLEDQLNYMKLDKERILMEFKNEAQIKQEEIEMLKEKLFQKEGIEKKFDDYKSKLESLREAI